MAGLLLSYWRYFLILPDGGWHGKNEVMSSEGNPAYESRAGVESKKELLSGLMDDGMLKLQDWDTVYRM